MIKLVVTLAFRLSLQFVFWLLVFSIKINERTVHTHALEYIEKNKILQSVGDKAEELWYYVRGILSRNVDGSGDESGFEPPPMDIPPSE